MTDKQNLPKDPTSYLPTKKLSRWAGITILILLFVSIIFGIISWIGYQPKQINKDILTKNPTTIIDRTEYISFLGKPTAPEKLLVFYPGASVSPSSYTHFLSQLEGIYRYVVLVKFPFNLALTNPAKGDEIIRLLQTDFSLSDQVMKDLHIYIGGHSLGAAMLSEYYSKTHYKDQIHGALFFGGYPAHDSLKTANVPALFIYGEVDSIIKKEELKKSTQDWQLVTTVAIEGMNHSQFGDYGVQIGDKNPYIDTTTVQKNIVKNIQEWSDKIR